MVLKIVIESNNRNVGKCSVRVVCVCVWSIESNETGSYETSTTT